MYGYFRPYDSNLTHGETSVFNAYYCRVCYCLRLIGGQLSRFFTTYDIAVYSMIINLQKEDADPPLFKCERLGTKTMRKFEDDAIGIKLARLSLISFGEKMRDDIIDDNNLKARLVNGVFSKAIKEARKAEPEITQIEKEGADLVNKLQDGGAPLDDILSAYGDMVVKSFSTFFELTEKTKDLLKSISKWIFFVDMVCDYKDDYKKGDFNALKTEGAPTFSKYFDLKYREFLEIEGRITGDLVNAVVSVRKETRLYRALFKIIMNSVNSVIADAIEGKDIKYHYFKDLFERYKKDCKNKSAIKRLGITKNEEN